MKNQTRINRMKIRAKKIRHELKSLQSSFAKIRLGKGEFDFQPLEVSQKDWERFISYDILDMLDASRNVKEFIHERFKYFV